MSNKFRIFETNRFLRRFEEAFGKSYLKIRRKLDGYVYPQLVRNPYFGKNIRKLKNYEPPTWRYRIGDYRFFYIIDETKHIVYMMTVLTRSDSYKK